MNELFAEAVGRIDAGDAAGLAALLAARPELSRERLERPGAWLRDRVGDALDGFFERPYLLWFVAEDPVRNGSLPKNVADVARTVIAAARQPGAGNLREQLDYALRLVCWSWVARECSVQLELIDVLIDAGACVEGRELYGGRHGTNAEAAIYNGNFGAAEHLLRRGAAVTLTTALCLERWEDVERLAAGAAMEEKQDAMVQAALLGQAAGIARMLALGVPATTVSKRNQSHATALHHAVASGSMEAVRVLVEAGADLSRRDTLYGGTALGWAEYGAEKGLADRVKVYEEIGEYLRGKQ